MPDLDMGNPVHAGAVLMLVVATLIVAIAMDGRRLPLGRVKYVPWTVITLFAMLGVLMAARNLVLVLMPGRG